jgi:hypothetical protein
LSGSAKTPRLRKSPTVGSNFMETTYIQFEVPKNEKQTATDGKVKKSLKKAVIGILTSVILKANPDYDKEIDKVKSWLIELETETGIPKREIGLNNLGEPILKMPYKNNYGYWTDNNLLLGDFKKHFQVGEIDKATFETKWNILL